MNGTATVAALAAALWLVLPTAAALGEVSGQFRAGDRAIVPRHASAYVVRDLRDPRREVVEVVLSEGNVDAEEAAASVRPHELVINQSGIGNYLLLWIRERGSVAMNATFSATMTQYLDSTDPSPFGGSLVAEMAESMTDRVAGRVRTAVPVKTRSGESYQVDVTFQAAIHRPPLGRRLEDGGAEPGKALRELKLAVDRKDWKTMRSRISARTLASIETDFRTARENRDAALDRLGAWLPKRRLMITRGTLRGEIADLDVEGEVQGRRRALVLVRMVREPDGWRFDEATIAGYLE